MNTTDRKPEPKTSNAERIRAVKAQIADLRRRWPAHSVPPVLMQQMDDLEEELESLRESA